MKRREKSCRRGRERRKEKEERKKGEKRKEKKREADQPPPPSSPPFLRRSWVASDIILPVSIDLCSSFLHVCGEDEEEKGKEKEGGEGKISPNSLQD